MLRIATLVAIVLAVFVGMQGAWPAADAAFPGTNGRIAYQDTAGDGQIWVMNPDGGNKTQVTSISSPGMRPAVTADGTHLFYYSGTRIRRAELDGPDDDGLVGTDGGMYPSPSPDGTRVAYNLDGDIMLTNPATNLTQTANPVHEYQPDWSPDGEMIVFAREDNNSYDLFVVPATGGTPVNLTNTPDISESSPDWSPDGQRIIFDVSPVTGTEEIVNIARIDADGQNYMQLTDGIADLDPAYSPDGQFFVFVRRDIGGAGVSPQGGGPSDIIVANADGTNQHSISGDGTHFHIAPDWGVDEPGTPTPSPTPEPGEVFTWGDNNCSGAADPVDSLLTLRHDAGLPINTSECPEMGEDAGIIEAPGFEWGDVDCDVSIGPIDSLKTLRYDAALSVSQEEDCPLIGSEVHR